MSGGEPFFDTNVLLYLLSGEEGKAHRAEGVVAAGVIISVQVLNEFASAARQKLGMPWSEVREVLAWVRDVCPVESMTVEGHDRATALSDRHGFSIYDAMIVASALAGCSTLYSEDMQHGQLIGGRLTNPFVAA